MRRKFANHSTRYRLQADYSRGLIRLPEINRRIASWVGHAQHADSDALRAQLFGEAVFQRDGDAA